MKTYTEIHSHHRHHHHQHICSSPLSIPYQTGDIITRCHCYISRQFYTAIELLSIDHFFNEIFHIDVIPSSETDNVDLASGCLMDEKTVKAFFRGVFHQVVNLVNEIARGEDGDGVGYPEQKRRLERESHNVRRRRTRETNWHYPRKE